MLVSVGIIDFQGSAAGYVSKVTQEKLNLEMGALGLKSGQLVPVTGMLTFDLNLMKLGSNTTTNFPASIIASSDQGNNFIGIIAGGTGGAALVIVLCLIYMKAKLLVSLAQPGWA